jgi:hypothetical protein
MTTERIESSPGAVLLEELKKLVDSFPADRRTEVMGLVRRIFNVLNPSLVTGEEVRSGERPQAGSH